MPLAVARGGGGALRTLYLNAVSRPFRVAISQPHVRRVCLATHRGPLKPITGAFPSSGILARQLVKTFATARKATDDKKSSTKTTKAKKTTKSAPKKKTTTKAKTAAKPRKQLTPKQLEAKEVRERRAKVKELKAIALDPPKRHAPTGWNVAVTSLLPEAEKTHKRGPEAFLEATQLAKNLSQEEKDRYAVIAKSEGKDILANFEKWINSHTPVQIRDANVARRKLAKLLDRSYPAIPDERLVKAPRGAFNFYHVERAEGGDFKHMRAVDVVRHLAEEWKGLTSSEKEKFTKLHEADRARYARECQEIYGDQPSTN